jgi:hypothetical protein
MTDWGSWGWPALSLLGAYHGVNPGMGWLFAVALGIQERTGRAVWRALLPLAVGHGLAIGAVLILAALAQVVLPLRTLKIAVAVTLLVFGVYRVARHSHSRWGGMHVGFRDLTIWSFLVAWAHGAGFMVVPIVLGMSAAMPAGDVAATRHHLQMGMASGPWTAFTATLVHTTGYLLVTGLIAWVVYARLGLALLRKAWLNLDLFWAVALILTGGLALLI